MFRVIAPIVLALSLAGTAKAQQGVSELTYCENLYALYDRYLAPRGESRSASVEAVSAVEQCRRGETAAGIAALEKKLRDSLFSLPPRG